VFVTQTRQAFPSSFRTDRAGREPCLQDARAGGLQAIAQ